MLEWIGVQNSTYDGGLAAGPGEVIQTGTGSNFVCDFGGHCNSGNSYFAWHAYVAGNANGIKNNTYTQCSLSVNAGDLMVGEVASQEQLNSTKGNTWYTDIIDYRTFSACTSHMTFKPTQDHQKYGKEYFADYFIERPQYSTLGFSELPQFKTFTFGEMFMKSSTIGTYQYYANGYGFGSYLYNPSSGGTQETTVSSMVNQGDGSGNFSEIWDSSAGTQAYYLTMEASPSNYGSVSPASSWISDGWSVAISATPHSGDRWCDWMGSGTGSYSGTSQQTTITVVSNITEDGIFASTICPNFP